MKKSEMFDILVREVCRQCEVSFDAVIGESKLQGAVVNSVAGDPCCTCSRTFVSETPITLTVA